MKRLQPALLLLALLVAAPRDAHAYLDPTTGSMVLQLLLGGIAGAAVLIRLFWRRILNLFGVQRHEHDGEA